jgi:GDP-D-mannose dehydratase
MTCSSLIASLMGNDGLHLARLFRHRGEVVHGSSHTDDLARLSRLASLGIREGMQLHWMLRDDFLVDMRA